MGANSLSKGRIVMGLGGELMWTSVAREIYERSGKQSIPVMSQPGSVFSLVKSDVFFNNPHFTETPSSAVPLVMNSPAANYCKSDAPDRAAHRYDRHAIEQACEVYGIPDPALKCELFLTQEEETRVDQLLSSAGVTGDFFVVEPNVKDEYSLNKRYPHEKWQTASEAVVSVTGMCAVQVGTAGSDVIRGACDLTGMTTFRVAAGIIARSKFLMCSEGGLMHAANAVGTRAAVIVTGFIHPRMTCYPENENVWIGSAHGPCGMKAHCDACAHEAAEHDVTELIEAALRLAA